MHTHGDLPSDVTDTVDLWVSDFLDRPAGRAAAAAVGEAAPDVLTQLVVTACDERGPAALSEAALAHALLDHGSGFGIPASAAACPDCWRERIVYEPAVFETRETPVYEDVEVPDYEDRAVPVTIETVTPVLEDRVDPATGARVSVVVGW